MKGLLLTSLLLAFAGAISANAQTSRRTEVSVAESPAVSKNPTFLYRTVSLSQEWDRLTHGNTFITTFGYTEPFRSASMALGVSVPIGKSQPAATRESSLVLSDVALKGQWIPYLTPRNGVLLSNTLTLPTSQEKSVGTGKWSVTPSAAFAHFWGPRFLLAQFVQQQVSFSGPSGRDGINRTDLDLYGVYSGRSLRWWITGDLNLRVDEHNRNKTSSSATVSYGRGLKKLFGGSLNGSLQTGAAVGRDRPYDAMLTGSLSLVGFH